MKLIYITLTKLKSIIEININLTYLQFKLRFDK